MKIVIEYMFFVVYFQVAKAKRGEKVSYLEDRNNSVVTLHTLYSANIPEYLLEFLKVPEVLRLNGIEQNTGIDFFGFQYI